MELIRFDKYIEKYSDPLVATIGSFDGIHLGHQALIKKTIAKSKKLNLKSAVITFDPHPLSIISNDDHIYITNIMDKAKLINNLGIDFLILINFDEEFSKISKLEFVEKYLKVLNVCEVVVGNDFKFGFHGEGKANEIYQLSNYSINTTIIDLIKYDNEKIGSSKIVNLLRTGKVEEANALLGYNFSFTGYVIKGNQIGRKMGFPTANIDNDYARKILKIGVYGVKVLVDNKVYLGMMNIGHNPTCNFQENISIEVNLFDENIDLYDKILKIECFCYVREERKFNNSTELIDRIKLDKEIIINKNHILAKK